MADLGQPIAYSVLERGAAVYSCDGSELGSVTEVRADLANDIFDGLVIRRAHHGAKSFVPGELVEEIFERGVLLKIDAEAAAKLPERPPAG